MKSKLYKICTILLFACNLFALTENESLLFKAVEENNIKEIERLIKISDLNINVLNEDGYAPIHIAVLYKQDNALKALLKSKKLDIETPIDDATELNDWYLGGETALLFASYLNNINAINILLDAGADIFAKDSIDETSAIHLAAANGNYEAVKLLIEYANSKKINIIETIDSGENTPLHWAAMRGHSQTVALLLENNANINAIDKDGWSALHYAASFDDIETVQVLLDNGALITKDYNDETPLYYASDRNIIALLGGECSYTEDEDEPEQKEIKTLSKEQNELLLAVKNGDILLINNLIKNGLDVNFTDNDGYAPIHRAVLYGKTTSLEELLKSENIDIEAKLPNDTEITGWYLDGATALLLASYLGNNNMVLILLNSGANILATDSVDGTMAIHIAAANGHSKVIHTIVSSKAAAEAGQVNIVNAGDENNDTALIWAAMKGRKNAVDMLLKYKADVNNKNNNNETALHYAASGDTTILETLYKNGAKLNDKTLDGYTPMHFATRYDNLENVKKLVELGADQNIKDKSGKTPYNLAEDKGYYDIVEYLSSLYTTITSKNQKEKWWSAY